MFGRRMQLAVLFFLGLLLVCIGKLAHLQLVEYSKYDLKALSSLTSEELVSSPRGRITDCKGQVLAEDVPSFDLSVRPRDLRLRELTVSSVKKIRAIRYADLSEYAAELKASPGALVTGNYSPEHVAELRELCAKLPPGGKASAKLLRKLRYAHYRAEREAAISRLATRDPVVAELSKVAGFPARRLAKGLYSALDHTAKNYGGHAPPAASGLKRENWDRLCLRQHYPLISGEPAIPGVYMTTSVRRRYRYGRTACHVLGYPGPMSERQYEDLAAKPRGIKLLDRSLEKDGKPGRRWFFKPNPGERLWLRPRGRMLRGRTLSDERVGFSGVEQFYNQHLRGKHAYRTWRLILQPAGVRGGSPEREKLRWSSSQAGGDIRLTLDLGVQRAAEKALKEADSKGAVVFLEPNDGSIIAMASYPNFNPRAFVKDKPDERLRLMRDRSRPLFCRVRQGQYPPGSVFKTIVAVAALEERAISPGTVFSCSHGLQVGNRWFECMFMHGRLPFSEALRRSCNTYFYHSGLKLEHESQRRSNPKDIHHEEMRVLGGLGYWGRAFGFGRHTGIDLPSEKRGLMPNRAWKRRRPLSKGGGPWTDGDTCNTAIGQGFVLVTPLQAAVAMAAIANGGTIVRPHVVQERYPRAITTRPQPSPSQRYHRWRLPLAKNSKTLAHVRQAMVEVVNNLGTGQRAKMSRVVVAGKTGSAQNSQGRTHAWFCGFAPADDPTVAFAVVLENAGHGGAEAAPVARKILEVLFPPDIPEKEAEGRG
jgi:cell division protein FtsI/penicillin-binding protein 2